MSPKRAVTVTARLVVATSFNVSFLTNTRLSEKRRVGTCNPVRASGAPTRAPATVDQEHSKLRIRRVCTAAELRKRRKRLRHHVGTIACDTPDLAQGHRPSALVSSARMGALRVQVALGG
jgi:hypothetical protein